MYKYKANDDYSEMSKPESISVEYSKSDRSTCRGC